MNGIYYQKTLGSGTPRQVNHSALSNQPSSSTSTVGPTQVIHSADASTIIDSTCADFVKEIQERLRTPAWHIWSLIAGGLMLLLGTVEQFLVLTVLGIIIAVVGGILGYVVYTRNRTTEINYDLDPHYGQRFSRLQSGFEQLCRSHSIWMVQTTAAVRNAKYHAGASAVLSRRGIAARLGTPSFLRVNLRLPILQAGSQTLCFLPDVVLVVQRNHAGAVSYKYLNIACNATQFIEDGACPSDSQQVGTTWRYVNKSGGPDRRFANNRQLPILRYAELRLQSSTGLNETIQVSNPESADAFAQGLRSMH